jgi:Secretion system C-terminal sorting domain
MEKKMRTIIFILALISSLTIAQTIYQVEPGMKGNKIFLTVENTSATLSVNTLEIRETNLSEFIDIKDNAITISNIEKRSEKEIEIEFDVMSEAPINELDTLHFILSNTSGGSWSKEIILEYSPPKEFVLYQNYPNPFNPSTTIKYSIPVVGNGHAHSATNVQLKIYDILGREVATLVNQKQQPGNYEVIFNAKHLSSGTYFYRLSAGNFSKSMKFILLK